MEPTPEQKIEKVEQQIRLIQLGAQQSIDCPYCGKIHNQGEEMCRKLMLCISAILQREEFKYQKEMAERIGEKVAAN